MTDETDIGVYLVPPVGTVDRAATVARHRVRLDRIDPRAPLQVGNGEFAFSVDVTGLQTFPEAYPVEGGGTMLGTMSQWGWHSVPPAAPYDLADTLRHYETPRGPVPYVDLTHDLHDQPEQPPAESWLRANPHRLDLGRIGLWVGADDRVSGELGPDQLSEVAQDLDLWTGVITSSFRLQGVPYRVTTAAHPTRDAVAVTVTGPAGRPRGLRLRFPYGSEAWGDAADWSQPDRHQTAVAQTRHGWDVRRVIDDTSYQVTVHGERLDLATLPGAEHDLVLRSDGRLDAVIEFSPAAPTGPALTVDEVVGASSHRWSGFWSTGATVDLSGSDHPEATDLERRIVLSQYLTAVNCAGSLPSAETGLMLNSWRGKFHLEMHWWHGAHFAAWGRPELLERSLGWYERIAPAARETAARQGYPGVRWPKQVGPEGRESPSSIGTFLVWQQPHPIYLAELVYRARPGRATLERWADLIFDTATFMAAFPTPSPVGYHLGPPIVPAQESYHASRATAMDPTFELAYWSWALSAAATWQQRLGLDVPVEWRDVAGSMAAPHTIDGRYAALATPPYLVRDDHPSMLAALGVVPPTSVIDPKTMATTFDDVWNDWDWDSTWGWDYPVAAMTATRLGRPKDATAALLLDRPKNTYLANGHNRQTGALPIYLPGNGGLLAAVALMAGGWDGSDRPTPGFGSDSGWRAAHEGLIRFP